MNKHKHNKSYIHPYPKLRYDINEIQEQNACEWNYWLTVDDSFYKPSLKADVWFCKHKDLMPYMKSGKHLDAFNEYIYKPRNLRKTLKPLAKKYINLIIKSWYKDKEIHDLKNIIYT